MRHLSAVLKCIAFINLSMISTSLLASEQGNSTLNLVTGAIKNFYDYYQESMKDVREAGGTGPVYWPQWEYEPGLGLINVLPEFSFINLDLFSESYYIFDVPTLPLDFRLSVSKPEIPAINRTVVGITEKGGFTNPHLPPLRWSADARIGIESQGSSVSLKLFLMAPEKLDKPFVDSAPGPHVLTLDEVELPVEKLMQGRTGLIQHTNICDPYIRESSDRPNPYSCGDDGKDDCYDFTLISAYVRTPAILVDPPLDNWNRLMGTPLHIRITNPKTPQAKVAEINYGESIFAPKRTGILFETITPADGRLFVARRAFLPLVWQNQANGKIQMGSYDVVYGVAPPEADPCDVTYWADLYPITHAPYDDRVNSRYPFAMQPFRDPSGEIIPDGVDIKGTYPWMDKEAKNFTVQVSPAKLFPSFNYDGSTQSRYPLRCVSESDCSVEAMSDTDSSKDNMYAIMGVWTQGKMVLLDGLLNDLDFRLGGLDKNHSYLSLYRSGTGVDPNQNGEVRVGSTRSPRVNYPVFDDDNDFVGTYGPGNISMFDSVENRLNYLPNMKPTRFHDVVWNMSSGHSTVEFAFDDYLNPDGFIVSNMVAHVEHQNSNWYRMNYYDGWHQLTRSFIGQVRVQNSATALPNRWQIPAYGRVYNGRMEPVANGGIRGKGMWFNGTNTRIQYEVTEQPQVVYEHDWFYSLFIDPRFADDNRERLLISFPDSSHITIKGRRSIALYNSHRQLITEVTLPSVISERSWTQLSLLVKAEDLTSADTALFVFVDGFLHHAWKGSPYVSNIERDNFRPTPGNIQLGKTRGWGGPRGFRGWMDEFKMFAYEPNLESICNFAHGSLVGLPSGYEGYWRNIANQYPSKSHEFVSNELSSYGEPTFMQYVCYHDYSADDKAHLSNLPQGTVPVRGSINFPEGPLYFDAPRPDSSTNEFCLSCHHEQGIAGLGLQALMLDELVNAREDSRRQPTQPPAKVYGNIPANWFPGAPSFSLDAGPEGVFIDEWLLESASYSGPKVKNLALASAEGHPWRAIGEGERIVFSTMPDGIDYIRANVNGLVRTVVFIINGTEFVDSISPFLMNRDLLEEGLNEVTVVALDNNGDQYSQSFEFYLE
ncbi:MAG: hypothetical protein MI867_06870 [Pseudomonadales bacterium]|nr:hypothetical protein [Pseudomonadales bacterium]